MTITTEINKVSLKKIEGKNLSNRSKEQLASCDIRLQKVVNLTLDFMDLVVIDGHREKKEQDEYFKSGKSRLEWPKSKHNVMPSLAIDMAPVRNLIIPWEEVTLFYYFAGAVISCAKQIGVKLRWGGDWKGLHDFKKNEFNDLTHFEIRD